MAGAQHREGEARLVGLRLRRQVRVGRGEAEIHEARPRAADSDMQRGIEQPRDAPVDPPMERGAIRAGAVGHYSSVAGATGRIAVSFGLASARMVSVRSTPGRARTSSDTKLSRAAMSGRRSFSR